jgi:nucleoside-diphosphate-sugar epimerase
MRILLTGHKGYIGAVMAPILLDAGHEVVGLDSDFFQGCTFTPGIRPVPELRLDLRDVEQQHLKGFDAVVHLAALSNDSLSNLNPEVTYDINHAASVRLARLAKNAGVRRFLFSSSCSVYGTPDGDRVAETARLDPTAPYSIAKVRVEQDVARLAGESFSPTFLRNATAYGVSPRFNVELVLNNLVAWAYANGSIYIKSDGSGWRPTVHVEDISRAFLAVLEAPREVVHNQALNVGQTEENYSIRELAEIVLEAVPGAGIKYAKNPVPTARSYRVDFGRIQRLLPGFKPRWNARQGAEQLYAAYRNVFFTVEDCEGPRFNRIAWLKQLLASGRVNGALRWAA